MDDSEPKITAGEAQLIIERLENAKSTVVKTLRPPMWLNVVSALLFGILTMAASLKTGSGVWTVALFLSAVAFLSTYVYWLHLSRTLGTKARFFPLRLASQLFYVAQGVFFAAVIFGSQTLHESGVTWAPYAAALVNGTVFSFLMHRYPTTEWGTRATSK